MPALGPQVSAGRPWKHPEGMLQVPGVTRASPGPSPVPPSAILTETSPLAILARTVEVQVIPRLLLARSAAPEPSAGLAPGLAGEADASGTPVPQPGTAVPQPGTPVPQIESFSSLLLAGDNDGVAGFLDALRARGMSVEQIYLDLLAPAARHLGDLWSADICDFTQVTIGVWRMQQMLHELAPAFLSESRQREQSRRAVMVPAPGDQHSFGMTMVADFFRRAGWKVWSGAPEGGRDAVSEMLRVVRTKFVSVVGFSMSNERRLDALAGAIRLVRRESRNPGIGVLVGGPTFIARPDLVALVGADATAVDGRQAVLQAKKLLALMSARA